MIIQYAQDFADRYATGPPPNIDTVAAVPGAPQIHEHAEAMTIHVTLSPTARARRHTGTPARPTAT